MKRAKWLFILFSMMFCVLTQNSTVKAENSDFTATWNGHTYKLIEDGMSWVDASESCKSQGGYLATITSEEEQTIIEALVLSGEKNGYWLGGYLSGGTLQWVTGEEQSYTNWAPGQPDDSSENYVMMYRITNPYGQDNNPGFWNDLENEGDLGEAFWLSNMGYVCEWDNVSEDNQIEENRRIDVSLYNIKGADDITFSYDAVFDKEYFAGENSEIVAWKGLLRLSALGAMSTYASKPDVGELSKSQKDKIYNDTNTLAFLKQCGFKDRLKKFSGNGKSNGKSTKKNNDHGTIYCGWQELDDDTRLFAFVISGYSSGGYEWVSNFNLGTGTVHAGFDNASDEMTKLAADYINKYNGGKEVKIWLMGHSRGAALTNLVSIKLVYNHGLNNKKELYSSKFTVDNSDIFAYGFATPQYTTLDIPGFENNILNYYSKDDFVPAVAPAAWSYKRAGKSIAFKNRKAMTEMYKKNSGHKYKGFTEKEKNKLIKEFVNLGGTSQYTYVNGYNNADPQDYGMNGIGMAMTSSWGSGVKKMLSVLPAAKLNTLLVFDGKATPKIMHSHEMLTYLSWIDADY